MEYFFHVLFDIRLIFFLIIFSILIYVLFNIKAVQGNFKDLFHFIHLDAIDFINFREIEF